MLKQKITVEQKDYFENIMIISTKVCWNKKMYFETKKCILKQKNMLKQKYVC